MAAGERSHGFVVIKVFISFCEFVLTLYFESKRFNKCFVSKNNERLKEEVSFEAFVFVNFD